LRHTVVAASITPRQICVSAKAAGAATLFDWNRAPAGCSILGRSGIGGAAIARRRRTAAAIASAPLLRCRDPGAVVFVKRLVNNGAVYRAVWAGQRLRLRRKWYRVAAVHARRRRWVASTAASTATATAGGAAGTKVGIRASFCHGVTTAVNTIESPRHALAAKAVDVLCWFKGSAKRTATFAKSGIDGAAHTCNSVGVAIAAAQGLANRVAVSVNAYFCRLFIRRQADKWWFANAFAVCVAYVTRAIKIFWARTRTICYFSAVRALTRAVELIYRTAQTRWVWVTDAFPVRVALMIWIIAWAITARRVG
jgi:hypothetical protein